MLVYVFVFINPFQSSASYAETSQLIYDAN